MNFPRVDLVFNPDIPSTKVRLIHDMTQKLPKLNSTLSLEILSADSGLGNLQEAAFSVRIHPFVRSFDISRCYQQVRSEGKYVMAFLGVWFENCEPQEGPFVLARESLAFGNRVLGLAIEILIYSYVDADLKDPKYQELLSSCRYSDNINVGAMSMDELRETCRRIVNSFSKFGLYFKPCLEPFCQLEDDDLRLEGEKETATLGYIWDLQKDEVSSTMDPAIVSKKRGMSKNVASEEAKVNPKLIT